MAVDGGYGPKGQPRFLDGGAPDLAVDSNVLGEYAALVGNRKVGTTAERNAALAASNPVQVWEGLNWYDTTDGFEYQYLSSTWVVKLNDTGWQAIPTASIVGYTDVANSPVSYRRINNVVYLRGRVSRTGGSDNFFQLPNGYRPVNQINVWPVVDSGNVMRRMQIANTGVMSFVDGGTFTNVSLQNVSFALG